MKFKLKKLLYYVRWIIGITLILTGIGCLFIKPSLGVAVALLGTSVCPIMWRVLKKWHIEVNKTLQFFMILALVLVTMNLLPYQERPASTQVDTVNSSQSAEQESIASSYIDQANELACKEAREAYRKQQHNVIIKVTEAATVQSASTLQTQPTLKTLVTVSEEDQDLIVHITDKGDTYHRANCRYLIQSDHEVTLAQALAKGLTPCSICKPPQ